MKITIKKLRKIIKEELRQALVVPRTRRQNDRKGFSSGIYEDSDADDTEEENEDK